MRVTKRKRGGGWGRRFTSESGRRAARARWSRGHVSARESAADDHGRALNDRRGELVRVVTSMNPADGRAVRMVIRFSKSGRTDQFDVWSNGRLVGTMGAKRLGAALGRAIAGGPA